MRRTTGDAPSAAQVEAAQATEHRLSGSSAGTWLGWFGPADSIRFNASPASSLTRGFASLSVRASAGTADFAAGPKAPSTTAALARTPASAFPSASIMLDTTGPGPIFTSASAALARTVYSPSPRAPVSAATAR